MADSGGLLSRCTRYHLVPRVRIPPSPPFATTLLLLSIACFASGCVERFLRIDSDPAGADLYVDGRHVGQAPVELPFDFYGTRRIDAWVADRPGVTQFVELAPPWYQRFPFDLFSELLDPVRHVDRHDVTIALPEAPAVPADAILPRADELRAETR